LFCPQSLTFLWTLQLTKFAVLYSFGSVLSLLRCAAGAGVETGKWQWEYWCCVGTEGSRTRDEWWL
jgi:hypothetical protein